MHTVKIFKVKGWIPAGLVVNAKLAFSSTSRNAICAVPLLAKDVDLLHHVSIAQADEHIAIGLKGRFLSDTIVYMIEDMRNLNAPYILGRSTYFDGVVEYYGGDDLQTVRLAVGRNSFANIYKVTSLPQQLPTFELSYPSFPMPVMAIPAGSESKLIIDPDNRVTGALPASWTEPGTDQVFRAFNMRACSTVAKSIAGMQHVSESQSMNDAGHAVILRVIGEGASHKEWCVVPSLTATPETPYVINPDACSIQNRVAHIADVDDAMATMYFDADAVVTSN